LVDYKNLEQMLNKLEHKDRIVFCNNIIQNTFVTLLKEAIKTKDKDLIVELIDLFDTSIFQLMDSIYSPPELMYHLSFICYKILSKYPTLSKLLSLFGKEKSIVGIV